MDLGHLTNRFFRSYKSEEEEEDWHLISTCQSLCVRKKKTPGCSLFQKPLWAIMYGHRQNKPFHLELRLVQIRDGDRPNMTWVYLRTKGRVQYNTYLYTWLATTTSQSIYNVCFNFIYFKRQILENLTVSFILRIFARKLIK